MTITDPTPHIEAAREKKCQAVVRFMLLESVKILADADEEMWRDIATRSNVNLPSEESRKRIIAILKGKI